jgi:hypothetical protein
MTKAKPVERPLAIRATQGCVLLCPLATSVIHWFEIAMIGCHGFQACSCETHFFGLVAVLL